jgi:hypothetical protein
MLCCARWLARSPGRAGWLQAPGRPCLAWHVTWRSRVRLSYECSAALNWPGTECAWRPCLPAVCAAGYYMGTVNNQAACVTCGPGLTSAQGSDADTDCSKHPAAPCVGGCSASFRTACRLHYRCTSTRHFKASPRPSPRPSPPGTESSLPACTWRTVGLLRAAASPGKRPPCRAPPAPAACVAEGYVAPACTGKLPHMLLGQLLYPSAIHSTAWLPAAIHAHMPGCCT